MKKATQISIRLAAVAALAAGAQGAQAAVPTAFDAYPLASTGQRTLYFDTEAEGDAYPVIWGLDTAWNDYYNMLLGVRYMGYDVVDVVRVGYNPYGLVQADGTLPSHMLDELKTRMEKVALITDDPDGNALGNKKIVDIALNQDAAKPYLMGDYYYLNTASDGTVSIDTNRGTKNFPEWARLIDATAKAVEDMGYKVVSVATFNEPDYWPNGLSKAAFKLINKELKKYPRFNTTRISGGNTLNCQEAHSWYDYLKEDLDEGNTHELAGDFQYYADFFTKVRNDGKFATADELHNVMEAIVGANYGMQEGIWWGTAHRARGEFCRQSVYGKRLAYGENRYSYSAAAVYKSPGKVQAFAGASERQARPSNYRMVSTHQRDVYVDGVGPVRDFLIELPGDANGAYQGAGQRNAEVCRDITWGEDVQPDINGEYYLFNQANARVIGIDPKATNAAASVSGQSTRNLTKATDGWIWEVKPAVIDYGGGNHGGDFSYHTIKSKVKLDNVQRCFTSTGDLAASATEKSAPRLVAKKYEQDPAQLWYLEYDGDGWFHIRSYVTHNCLQMTDKAGTATTLSERPYIKDEPSQKFRFMPVGPVFTVQTSTYKNLPDAPAGLNASAGNASVHLKWTAPAASPATKLDLYTYQILRAGADGAYNTIARGITATEFVDNNAPAGGSYKYRVRAIDAFGNYSPLSAEVAASPTYAAGRTAYYTFENTLDDGTDNYMNAKHPATVAYAAGHNGQGLQLSGSQFVQLPMAAAGGRLLSVAAWVNWTDANADGQTLFDFGLNDDNHIALEMRNGGKMKLSVVSDGVETALQAPLIASGTWTHVAAVVSDRYMAIYHNGAEVARLDADNLGSTLKNDRPFNFIGRGQTASTFSTTNNDEKAVPTFHGTIDDLNIYNCTLTPSDVVSVMNGTQSGIAGNVADRSAALVNEEYFNLKGQRIEAPAAGEPTLVRRTYSDGRVVTDKTL